VFGIGWTEFILVALVLLLFVGPKHLPGMLRKFAEVVGELKSASRELREQIEEEIGDFKEPAKMVKKMGRDLMKDMPSPYEEARDLENSLKQKVNKEVDDIKKSVVDDPPAESAETGAADVVPGDVEIQSSKPGSTEEKT
jgi:sec-independent protein translocase protein TatB